LVNCWHINPYESDGMWKLYSNMKNSIAIQTTVGKLKESFSETEQDIFIGKVKYIDFDTEFVQAFNMAGPFIYKRKSFEHEQELRAVIWNTQPASTINEESVIEIVDHGMRIQADINKLIDKVYISPLSDSWFESVVKNILQKYDVHFPIISSNLLNIPDYITLQKTLSSNEKHVTLPNEVLKSFIEKDSFRIQREEDERVRIITLQTDSIQKKMELISSRVKEIKYKRRLKVLNGVEAINAIGFYFIKRKNIKFEILVQPESNLFMLIGYFEALMIEITTSIIPETEKNLLLKNACFLFTEYCIQGFSLIAFKIAEDNKDDKKEYFKPLNAFAETVFKFRFEIEKNGF